MVKKSLKYVLSFMLVVLVAVSLNSLRVSAADVIKISSQEDFEAIAENLGGNYVLTKNLVFSEDYVPVGDLDHQFYGNFDGKGHTITLNIDSDGEYVGLFSSISTCSVKNLNIKGSVKGKSSVGALTGFAWNSEISNVNNYAVVKGDLYVGGIVGWIMYGDLNNCTNYADVTGFENGVGGIVGMANTGAYIDSCINKGNILNTRKGTDCYDFSFTGGIAGNLRAATVVNSANYGDVSCDAAGAGGITGDASSNPDEEVQYYGYVLNCYNEGNISGHSYVGGINGGNTHGWIENCVNVGDVSLECISDTKICFGPISGHDINYNPGYDTGEKYYNYYAVNKSFSKNGSKYGKKTSSFTNAYGKLNTAIKLENKKYTDVYSVINAWVDSNQSKSHETSIFSIDGKPYTKTLNLASWTVQNGKFVLNISGKEVSKYKVSYVLNGGKNSSKNKSFYKNTSVVKLYNPTRKGYTFAGWYTDNACTNSITKINKGNISPVKVYAKWIKNK